MTRRRIEWAAWFAGAIGLLGAVAAWRVTPAAVPSAWLAATAAWLEWPIGCMGALLVHALTGGGWGYVTRRQLVAGMLTLMMLPLALGPLMAFAPTLYPWLRPDAASGSGGAFYLNAPFGLMRVAIYVVVWCGLALAITRALRGENADRDLARIAPAGLLLLAITVTFSAIDATMSLDPRFASSAYGLVAISEAGLLALSAAVLGAVVAGPLDGDSLRDLGKLLLGLLVLWAYLDFMQGLIVWQSDLPREAAWYLPRTTGRWGAVAVFVVVGHFFLPFLALLSPRVRRSRLGMGVVASLLILGEITRNWWLVLPASGATFDWVDLSAMIGVTAIAVAIALRASSFPWLQKLAPRRV